MNSVLRGVFQELKSLNLELKNRAMNETPGTQAFCITEEEWVRVLHLAIKCDFPAYLFLQPYGFAFGVYGRISPDCKPELLLRFDAVQLPMFLKVPSISGSYDERATLSRIFEFTHAKVNTSLIERYGLEPLCDDPAHYAYA